MTSMRYTYMHTSAVPFRLTLVPRSNNRGARGGRRGRSRGRGARARVGRGRGGGQNQTAAAAGSHPQPHQPPRGRGRGNGNASRARLHPNGQRRIAIHQIAAVYGYSISVNTFVRSRTLPDSADANTTVTPGQVRRARDWDDSDDDDAWGILEDIDTQWGACPWGGMLDVAGGGSD